VIELENVRAAAERLDGVAHRTPLLMSSSLDAATGARVALKAENLQRGGAFKFRGAYNKISSLKEHELAAGVTTFSSGNHAQAVALSARLLGTSATILMPEDAPSAKLEATRGYGATVITYDRYAEDRTELGNALAHERGLTMIHPYDDELVMSGQGTVALEIFDDQPETDVLVVPVGGGGLISGCSTVAKALSPGTAVIGVEPEAGDDTRRSLAAGHRVKIDIPRTIADGQQVDTPGELTFEVIKARVDDVVLVADSEIVGAMAFMFERLKIVAEPSGAAALAAVLAGKVDVAGKCVAVVVSGGNLGIDRFVTLFG
jgi:threo-3-hydroxy-L-aspartate ammonia-lyase